jgi:eukaryotic-like serine/threonine-protein kinase
MVEHPARTPAHRVITGRYALTARLGQRGTRTIWRAHDTVLRRDVAVEEIRLPSGEQESAWTSLLRAARAAARLPLPGTITVFDAVLDGDELFVITELVPARTLAELVETDGPLAPDKAAAIGLELLAVLEGARRRRITHDGVSPANVLLVDGRAKLSGFGLGELCDFGADLRALAATLHFAVVGRAQPTRAAAPGLTAALAGLRGEEREDRPSLPRLREELAALVALAEKGQPKALALRPVGAVSAGRQPAPEPAEPAQPAARILAVASTETDQSAPAGRRTLRVVPVALVVTVAAAVLVAVVVALLLLDRARAPALPAAVAIAPVSRQSDRTEEAWRVYEPAGAGFTIRVPATWSSEERPRRVVLRAPDRAASAR